MIACGDRVFFRLKEPGASEHVVFPAVVVAVRPPAPVYSGGPMAQCADLFVMGTGQGHPLFSAAVHAFEGTDGGSWATTSEALHAAIAADEARRRAR